MASPFRIINASMIRREANLDDTNHAPSRDLSAAVPSDGGEPDGLPRPRSRIDGVARPPRLSRSLDRRASFGWVRDHRLARDLYRDRRRAHEIHPLRHRRHLAAVPQPADGGGPHCAARPPHARTRHVRRGAGASRLRRADAGDRPDDPARPHGRRDRRDPALFRDETVTEKTDWYTLVNARLHLPPYTKPYPEMAVVSAVTPSGGRLAGKYDLNMICVAATN